MSGKTENNWQFDVEKYEKMAGVKGHVDLLVEKLKAFPWWNSSIQLMDFGCGVGMLSRALVSQGLVSKVYANDVELKMIELLEKRVKEDNAEDKFEIQHLKKLDASELKENVADCLITVTVLGHVREADMPVVFANAAKAVKKGGRIIVSEFSNWSESFHEHSHEHGHEHSHGHEHAHEHSHGHGHGHGHVHGHAHGHNHDSSTELNLEQHVSDGGHFHTCINEEILRKLAADNHLEVESVEDYTLDLSQEFGVKDCPMILFVAKR